MVRQRTRLLVEELERRLTPSGSRVTHAIATSTSSNWSGYAALTDLSHPTAGAVTAVYGTWVVPSVSGTGTAYSSAWVGIDGYGSSTVEQIGTSQDIVNGKASYYAWFEMYPSYPVTITSVAIHAGDKISAQVVYVGGKFNLSITNVTTGKSFSTAQSLASAKRLSAEWIMEAPSSNRGVLPLSNFSSMTFSEARATINGTTGPVDSAAWKAVQITLVSSSGVKSTPSALTDSGSTSSFSVTYTGAPAPTPHRSWWWFFQNNIPSSTDPSPDSRVVVIKLSFGAGFPTPVWLLNPVVGRAVLQPASGFSVSSLTSPPAAQVAFDHGFRLSAEEAPELIAAPQMEAPKPGPAVVPAEKAPAQAHPESINSGSTLWPGALEDIDRFYAINFPADEPQIETPLLDGRRGLDLASGAGLSALLLGFYLKLPAERPPDRADIARRKHYAY